MFILAISIIKMPIGMKKREIVAKNLIINIVSFDQNKINKLYEKSTVYPIKNTFLFCRAFFGRRIINSIKIDINKIKKDLKFCTLIKSGSSLNDKYLNTKNKDI
jgi:hypothetical protein